MICLNDTPPTGVTLPVVTGATVCAADTANPLLTNGYYNNKSHYGMGAITFKPVKRVTTLVGYSITNVDGTTPLFNPLQPGGSLQYNYHSPWANFTFDLGHNLAWNAGWNDYQYNEKSFVGPTAGATSMPTTQPCHCAGLSEPVACLWGGEPAAHFS